MGCFCFVGSWEEKKPFSSRLKWRDVEYIKSTSELTISHLIFASYLLLFNSSNMWREPVILNHDTPLIFDHMKGRFTWGPKSLEVNPCNLNFWEHGSWGLTTLQRGPKHDMDAYMATFFGGEAWDVCWDVGSTKSQTQLSTKVPRSFLHKIIKIWREW